MENDRTVFVLENPSMTAALTVDVTLLVRRIRDMQDRIWCDACRPKFAEVRVSGQSGVVEICRSCRQHLRLLHDTFRQHGIDVTHTKYGGDPERNDNDLLRYADKEALEAGCLRLARFVGEVVAMAKCDAEMTEDDEPTVPVQ